MPLWVGTLVAPEEASEMVDGSFQPSMFGGPEGSVVKVELSEDALGIGRAVAGIAREIRKGPEGLLDRADRFYQFKHIILPVHSAKRDAKAMAIRAEALREATELLAASSPEGIAATRMMIADYTRRYQNIDATITQAMPMIDSGANPENIDDDWLGYAFEYIGGVSDELVQQLWARLLAQEANQPGRVSKRAVTKLALMDRRSTYQLRKVLRGAITLYVQTPDRGPNTGHPFYKIGRFAFPLLIEMLEWSGPRPNDDLLRGLAHGHDGPSPLMRDKMRWLIEEGFLRAISQDLLREGYLNASHWEFGWKRYERPLGIRIGLGSIYGCDAREFIEMVRRYSNDAATARIVQLTGLAEALLDPRINSMESVDDADLDAESWDTAKKIEDFLVDELNLEFAPPHESIAENPGFLGRGFDGPGDLQGLEFYYHEY
jgi:Protein of unknown function (DUF2806)